MMDIQSLYLYGLDLEMEPDEGEHQALQILNQVVETAETVRVSRLVDINQAADLAGCERDVLVPNHNLKLLAADPVWLRPKLIIFSHDLAVLDDPPQLIHHSLVRVSLLADHCIILVVTVVSISELAVWPELKLEELMSELAFVSNIVAQVEVVGHVDANLL